LYQIFYSIVGWVEVTKPFGSEVPERLPCPSTSRPLRVAELQGPRSRRVAEGQGNAQQAKRFGVGFRYRSTQPTIIYMKYKNDCYK